MTDDLRAVATELLRALDAYDIHRLNFHQVKMAADPVRALLARPVDEPQMECARCRGRIVIGQRAAAMLEAEGIPARSLEHISDRDITEADIQRIKELGEKFNWRERIEARRGSIKEPPHRPIRILTHK